MRLLIRTLFLVGYIMIGIGINTAAPHYPQYGASSSIWADIHSTIQYVISILSWPLAQWGPSFTLGKWTP